MPKKKAARQRAERRKRSRDGASHDEHGNIYASLAAIGENDPGDGEMNSSILERFSSANSFDDRYPDPERVPLPTPSRLNNDVWEYFHQAKQPVAGGGAWLEKSELPNSSEILANHSTGFTVGEQIIDLAEGLRPNKLEGPYDSKDEYLGTQYELLREDATRPLREAIAEVRKNIQRDESEFPPSSRIGIYEPVYIKSVVFSPRGLAVRVAFSLSRVKKFIRWKQSKRLITGSLIALSPYDDAFQTKCILATVAARPVSALECNPPEIDLFFASSDEIEIDPTKKFIMVESRASFYEASRHTLLALQHMRNEPFPLSEHLVKAKKEVEPPAYVKANPYMDMSSIVNLEEAEKFQNVNILEEWPSGDSHGLDKSQSKALRRILTKCLAIVQGPPGTGKTYTSVIALKILLANLRREDSPIIITCQTNHALDQLLRHVAEFEPNFIRLGGQTKDTDKIKKRTLFEVRQNNPQQRSPHNRKSKAVGALRNLTSQMQDLLLPLESAKGPLDHHVLQHFNLITQEQADSLDTESQYAMGISQKIPGIQMEQWLGRCLEPCPGPVRPDHFGVDLYEDEDFDGVEQLQELEAEAVAKDDDDIEALKGPVTSLSDNYNGKIGPLNDEQIANLLKKTQDLTTIPPVHRGSIYNYFLRQVKRCICEEFRRLARQYENAVQLRRIGQYEQDQRLLRDQRLVGMTTTGLSKYRALIASLRPRIVLVEEAGETLEPPVSAACMPSLEHLILVGDHQQLRPHCQIHAFEDEPYYFNLSLFERMVFNDVEIDSLKLQRRMVPEIRRLLEPIYGNTLKDQASVTNISNRPPVEGMGGCNSYFFTHEWLEERDHNMSAFNAREADLIVGFFNYLVLNGVDSAKITILTFYNGQRSLLLKRLRSHQNLRGLKITVVTVDSYQGEENDIVLLSLVRSNRKSSVGFLAVDNRVCVALSRAKRGFYVFGNAEMLACESQTWAHVVNIMYGKGKAKDIPAIQKRRIGYLFPLQCANHGNKTWVEDPEDWELINGGCDKTCRCLLPCGHVCMLKCHPFGSDRINCTQQCTKRIPACGHPCASMCCDPCRCMICERYNNGAKAMLKPRPTTEGKGYGPSSQSARVDATIHAHPLAITPSTTEHSGISSTTNQWIDYASEGAKEDDARMIQTRQKEIKEYHEMINHMQETSPSRRLIQVSPEKGAVGYPAVSKNTELLLDLSMDVGPLPNEPQQHSSPCPPARHAVQEESKEKAGKSSPPVNLLD